MTPEDKRLLESWLSRVASPERVDGLTLATPGEPVAAWPPPHGQPHTSHGYELACALLGSFRVITPVAEYTVTPGGLLLIPRGLAHLEAPAEPPLPYHALWLSLRNTSAQISDTWYPSDNGCGRGLVASLAGRTDVESLAHAIASELTSREVGWEQAVRALLVYLTTILVRRVRHHGLMPGLPAEAPAVGAESPAWRTVRAALDFCARHLSQPITVAEIASAVPCHPKHLNRVFSRVLGRSVHDQLRTMRMETAKRLLRDTDLPIASIATSVGYSDHAHFTRAFTRATGLSPKAFREQVARH